MATWRRRSHFSYAVIRRVSVITLTEDVMSMPMITGRRHYVASRRERSRDYASAQRAKGSLSKRCIRRLPLTYRRSSDRPLGGTSDGEGLSMSYETRNVWRACFKPRPRRRARARHVRDRRVQRRRRRQCRHRHGAGSGSGSSGFSDRVHEGPAARRGQGPPSQHRSCATFCVSRSAPISICAIARLRRRPSATSRRGSRKARAT